METINKLERRIKQLEYEISVIKTLLFVSNENIYCCKESLSLALDAGLRPSPYGQSLELLRLIELMNKLGLFTK